MNQIIPAMSFALTQTNDAPVSSSPAAGPATKTVASVQTDAPASPDSGARQNPGGLFGGGLNGILMIGLMFVVFYLLLIRPQQKKAKEHQNMIDSLKKGTEIITSGGLVGRITGESGKTLTVEIADKVRVRVLRSQVAGVYSAADNAEKK